jgi:hypothetical protein
MENAAKKLGNDIGRGRNGYSTEEIKKKRKVRLNVYMDSAKYIELKELASFEDKTVSDLIRELVDKLLLVEGE